MLLHPETSCWVSSESKVQKGVLETPVPARDRAGSCHWPAGERFCFPQKSNGNGCSVEFSKEIWEKQSVEVSPRLTQEELRDRVPLAACVTGQTCRLI